VVLLTPDRWAPYAPVRPLGDTPAVPPRYPHANLTYTRWEMAARPVGGICGRLWKGCRIVARNTPRVEV